MLKLNNKRSNVIVSHRAVMEEERQKKRAETLEKLKEGVLLTGAVKISQTTEFSLISAGLTASFTYQTYHGDG